MGARLPKEEVGKATLLLKSQLLINRRKRPQETSSTASHEEACMPCSHCSSNRFRNPPAVLMTSRGSKYATTGGSPPIFAVSLPERTRDQLTNDIIAYRGFLGGLIFRLHQSLAPSVQWWTSCKAHTRTLVFGRLRPQNSEKANPDFIPPCVHAFSSS